MGVYAGMVRVLEAMQRKVAMSQRCMRCGREITAKPVRFGTGTLCLACAEEMENEPGKCPVCGTVFEADDAVAMLLTRATATPQERLTAHSALVQVCPKCHVLFFDDFQYGLLEGLKTAD